MSAKVILYGSFKGGVGKTTCAVSTAAELGRRGHRVKILDMDPQASAMVNISMAPSPEAGMPVDVEHLAALVRTNPRGISAAIQRATDEYDFVIIDTPGNIESDGTQMGFVMSDLVVVPLRPGAYDLNSTRQTVALLEKVLILNPELQIRTLRVAPARTSLNASIERALLATGVPVFDTAVKNLVAFNEMALSGRPLWALGRTAQKAHEIVKALVNEILLVLDPESSTKTEPAKV